VTKAAPSPTTALSNCSAKKRGASARGQVDAAAQAGCQSSARVNPLASVRRSSLGQLSANEARAAEASARTNASEAIEGPGWTPASTAVGGVGTGLGAGPGRSPGGTARQLASMPSATALANAPFERRLRDAATRLLGRSSA
jgi:hypothetical protein